MKKQPSLQPRLFVALIVSFAASCFGQQVTWETYQGQFDAAQDTPSKIAVISSIVSAAGQQGLNPSTKSQYLERAGEWSVKIARSDLAAQYFRRLAQESVDPCWQCHGWVRLGDVSGGLFGFGGQDAINAYQNAHAMLAAGQLTADCLGTGYGPDDIVGKYVTALSAKGQFDLATQVRSAFIDQYRGVLPWCRFADFLRENALDYVKMGKTDTAIEHYEELFVVCPNYGQSEGVASWTRLDYLKLLFPKETAQPEYIAKALEWFNDPTVCVDASCAMYLDKVIDGYRLEKNYQGLFNLLPAALAKGQGWLGMLATFPEHKGIVRTALKRLYNDAAFINPDAQERQDLGNLITAIEATGQP